MIDRNLESEIMKYLSISPITALLGPRQCGKSTLARKIITDHPDAWIYLDLERPSDLRQLDDPELFFISAGEKIVCIDEIQLRPDIFPVIRSIVDEKNCNAQIFLLGSASPQLLKQGSESLAGRIMFLELTPFTLNEIPNAEYQDHLVKGGFPRSFLSDEETSYIWRQNFIRTFIERDLITLGTKLTSMQLQRLLTMCAHLQGQIFNISKISESLGISRSVINNWLDILIQTFMIRRLEPFEVNLKKRLVKSPKLYVRDSGLVNSLLELRNFQHILSHPGFGNIWEGYAIENILIANPNWNSSFYRTSQGAEIDLVLSSGSRIIAVECKATVAPKLTKGFWTAIEDIGAQSTWVIIPEGRRYSIRENVHVISLKEFLSEKL
ncbi:MAG: ATP-binding protein [Spirochaetales bacterium]|nr:ATP-binding protein [Spirochaetales bacterium]